MTKLKSNQIFLIYIIIFALAALIFKTVIINAEEVVSVSKEKPMKVVKVEINNNPNFKDVIKSVLSKDLKYIIHPKALEKDVSLSEIVASDIDYSSYEVQEVVVEVQRYTDSKTGKIKIDSVQKLVKLQFIDLTPPEITLKKASVTITEGEDLDVNEYLESVTDNSFEAVLVDVEDDVDTNSPGTYTAVFSATDSSKNTASKTLTVIVKEKPKPVIIPVQVLSQTKTVVDTSSFSSGVQYSPSRVTRYGFDCRGCNINSEGYSSTAGGIKVAGDSVRQPNGEWHSGYTYDGYYIVATSRDIPLFSILKISNHPFAGGGISAGEPFYAIVGDRGVSGTALDLFIGTERNLNVISQRGNPNSSNTVVEIVRSGR